MGACPATLVQPRPYSSPGAPALLPARRASPSGSREVRDKGVTYYSVDLGRMQRGGRDKDADRDVTVIPVIPGRRAHQGRCGGAGHHRPGSARAAKVPAQGGSPPVSARSVTSSSCAWRSPPPCRVVVVVPGHQFQLRTAVPLGLRGFSRCPSSPVPVAHCRSFLLQGLSGHGRSHGFPLCTRSSSRAGLRCGHQVQLRIAYLLWEPPGDGREGLHGSPPLRVGR
jgi:hypothetical protein